MGGGAGGFALAPAAAERLRREGVEGQVSLIASGPPLAAFPARVRSAGARALAKAGVAIVAGDRAVEADAAGLRLSSGRRVAAEAILVAADAQAPAWLTETGLTLDPQGYVAVSETLQGLSHPDVFAAGDCAAISGHPRPKAGVFAVRQGPPLAENLRRAARGAPLTRHRPQRAFLSLLSTADGRAIASRGRWSVEGGWVWRWKDRIDRAFMERHRPEPMAPDAEMRCGGCAAKLGPLSLAGALAVGADEHEAGSFEPEDASLLPTASAQTLRVDTVDFFRAFWPDPYLLGRIAANHAMSDVYAMGGAPKTALAVMVTPEAHPRLAEEDLRQMTAGGRAQLEDAGAALVGGHSSEGAELAAGFAVSGEVAQAGVWRKGGLRAGDRLILTGPIGSGVIFAAAGRGLARGAEVSAALAAMGRPHAPCVQILRAYGATGVTDVTGFGLMGHLLEMLRAAGLTARLDPAAPRLLPGAERLAALGVASSLAPDNLALAEAELAVAPPSVRALLLDPQTAGPLLAGAPGDRAEQCVSALRAIGREAAVIGDVMESALGASDPAPRVQLMSLAAGSQRSGSAKTLSGAS
ncbi:MAG: selenide, water dikinase SelD [Pseudomonadota bacterium]